MGGQRCARPGCRAWAMRGRSFCRAHRRQEQDGSDAELADREEGRDPAVFESLPESLISPNLVTTQVEALLTKIREIEGSELTLREEIGVLRLVLARVLAEEPDLNRQAASVPRIINTVIRAVRAQRLLAGVKSEAITEALTQILIELGLGSDDDQ
ncbi:MAG TPA: hypothetical protein VKU87_00805 [Thermomicrobiaceae bacterium]|nr:hypothetical protein [Thermomicrobiaceae bacterium]